MNYKDYMKELKAENEKSNEAIKNKKEQAKQLKIENKNKKAVAKENYKIMKELLKNGEVPSDWANICDIIVKECSKDIKKGKPYGIYSLNSRIKNYDSISNYMDLFEKYAFEYFKQIGFKVSICLKRIKMKSETIESFSANYLSNKSDYTITLNKDKRDCGTYMIIVLGLKKTINAKKHLESNASLITNNYIASHSLSGYSRGVDGTTHTYTKQTFYYKKWKI